MNAPMVTPYEPYRVILDYEALQDGFLDRIDELNTTLEQIEMNAGFARGNAQKLLTKSAGKMTVERKRYVNGESNLTRFAPRQRKLGWESLGKMLKGTGLALVLVIDDERFAPLKEQLMQRKRPRQPANAGSSRPAWLFTKAKAREMGKKRFATMTEAQRKRHQRKAGKASAAARRRKAKLAAGDGALLPQPIQPCCADDNSQANT